MHRSARHLGPLLLVAAALGGLVLARDVVVGAVIRAAVGLAIHGQDVRIPLSQVVIGDGLTVEGRLLRGRLNLAWSARAAWSRRAATFRISLPDSPCEEVWIAAPPAVHRAVPGLALEGSIAVDLEVRADFSRPGRSRVRFDVEDRCRIVPGVRHAPVAGRAGRFAFLGRDAANRPTPWLTGPDCPGWTRLEEISPYLLVAVIEAEDPEFFSHRGFSTKAWRFALARDIEAGRLRYGGSNITQQLAKNLFLGGERTLARKVGELYLAWYLERRLSKQELLEIYLNVVEVGAGLHGVGAAADRYFGRTAGELDLLESLFIAKLLPSPRRRGAQALEGNVYLTRQRVLFALGARLADKGRIEPSEYLDALATQFVFHRPGARRPPPRPPAVRLAEILDDERWPWASPSPGPRMHLIVDSPSSLSY